MFPRRIITSIAALLVITAAHSAKAAQAIEPSVTPSSDVAEPVVAPAVLSASQPVLNSLSEPAVPSSVAFDLSAVPRIALDDKDVAIRALRQYDQMIKADPFGLRLQKDTPTYSVKPPAGFAEDRNDSSLDMSPRRDFRDHVYGGDRFRSDYDRLVSNQRQRTADRIADMIHPGFGRSEFMIGANHVRVDYIYAKRCNLRGIGICLRMNFR